MRLTPAIEFHRMSTLRVCMVRYTGFTVAQCAKVWIILVPNIFEEVRRLVPTK